jgi:release factor glutamine methyltransferase
VAETSAATSPTVGGLLAAGVGALTETSQSPRLDAELLLADALGCDRAQLVLARDEVVGDGERARYAALVHRRAAHEPVAYLLGHRGFRWIDLAVDSRVLVPRPETELLVEVGLTLAIGATVIDVGTGSGAIALALAQERPDLSVRGVDVSTDAVALARQNAETLNLDVSFQVGDLLDGVPGPFDAVLANLPYIADADPLPRDVADHEPSLALYGGPDGLGVIRRLIAALAGGLWPELVALEIGETQGETVAGLVAGAGFDDVEVRQDLTGRDRVVVGRR